MEIRPWSPGSQLSHPTRVSQRARFRYVHIQRREILFGIERLPPGRRRLELEASANRAFRLLPCEAVPAEAARIYAKVKAAQQMQGLSLDENDLWIAATTLSLSATLVTADSDFLSIQRSENGCDHYALAPALQVFLCGCAPFREKDLISNHL